MIPLWVAPYVKVPFKEKGRDWSGWDCWGCVRMVLREQLGLTVPSYTEDYQTTNDREEIVAIMRGEAALHWQEIQMPEAALFDCIELRISGLPIHFGIVVSPPWFLHATKSGTACERWDSVLWKQRIMGFVRWRR